MRFPILLMLFSSAVLSAPPEQSSLPARGYAVLPAPQEVTLHGGDFPFASGWRLVLRNGVDPDGVAVETLRESLAIRHHVRLQSDGAAAPIVTLEIRKGAVAIGKALDRDREVLAAQAYRSGSRRKAS